MFTVIPSLVSHSGLVHQLLRLLSTCAKSLQQDFEGGCKSAKGAGLGQLQAKIVACHVLVNFRRVQPSIKNLPGR